MTAKLSYHAWKQQAIDYAMEVYALDANGIDDDWHMPSYNFGMSPTDSVDAFADKYALQRIEDIPLDEALYAVAEIMRADVEMLAASMGLSGSGRTLH
ncbi:hypothetical protein J2J97_32070 (plasmid) [Rhizobium bangladeshense]|uniref:hypothetical protein n=1 Tax=Rhizobium bangladeshense TaxID=1138189 RepID=UPI001A9A146C|nr:hypothetical protein [Rhizobium bangladeshense]QSY98544.1 hypothetical protein J2J97_32070 [Rhizobium bangladeshense]